MIDRIDSRKILFLSANPPGTGSLRLSTEVKRIREGLQRSQNRDLFVLREIWDVNPTSLRRAMMDEKPNIVHFSGHGTGERELILEGYDEGTTSFASSNALEALFRFASENQEHKLECIILNACHTEYQAEAISKNIDYVIGMSESIPDSIAIEFSAGFYDALFSGKTIKSAYEMGLIAIKFKNIVGDSIPVLKTKPAPDPKQRLIVEKTRDFVGRQYVFNEISRFISSHANGYFEIIGDPGMGKSSILAKYVQETDCISYFNIHTQANCNTAEDFLHTISVELIQKYKLSTRPIPSDDKQYASFLDKLLEESSQNRDGKNIIVVIDALDEVDENNRRTGLNILYLPVYLPDGVYVIVTRRQGVNLRLMTHSPKGLINLLDYNAESYEDICLYIENRVNKSGVLQETRARNTEFTRMIAVKSENNFMYLFHALSDIERGVLSDMSVDAFPSGLDNYYKWHWERMGMNVDPLPELKIKVVYYLAAAREPITLNWLAKRIPCEDLGLICNILIEWKQFLHQVLDHGERKHSIYHASYRDFLYLQETLDGVRTSVENINDEIVKSLTKGIPW
jgi:hypothetical protein